MNTIKHIHSFNFQLPLLIIKVKNYEVEMFPIKTSSSIQATGEWTVIMVINKLSWEFHYALSWRKENYECPVLCFIRESECVVANETKEEYTVTSL